MTCRHLGCTARAAARIVPQYGRPFPVCATHGPPWLETLTIFDNRQAYGSRMVLL